MSRRKQANPRSLKVQEDNLIGQEVNGNCYKLVSKYNGIHDDQESDQDLDDYDEYGPLVVDIPSQDLPDNDSLSSRDQLGGPVVDQTFNDSGLVRSDRSPSDAGLHIPSVDTSGTVASHVETIPPTPYSFISSPVQTFNQDHSNSSSEKDQLFIDVPTAQESGTPIVQGSGSAHSRTPSLSSLSEHQLSPGGLSSSISASKVHRRGKKTQSEADDERLSDDEEKILPVASEGGQNRYVCPICQEVVSSSHDLTVHIRTHNSQQPTAQANTCTICGKVLSSQSSLDRHMLVHSGERPFQCKVCKMSFTTNGNMHRHSRIHSKENDLNGSAKASRSKPKSSSVNLSYFSTTPPSNTVLSNTPSSSHASLDIQLTPPLLSRDFTPRILGYGEPSSPKDLLSPGMKRPFSLLGYPADWSSVSPSKRPYIPSTSISESKTSAFSSPSSLAAEKDEKVITPVITTTSSVPRAEENNVPKDKPLTIEIGEKDPDQLHCPVCNKAFLCKYGLETHLETHPNFSMKCSLCDMSFPTPRGLSMHKLMMHSKERVPDDPESRKMDMNSETTTAVIGFYDLSFVDFSVTKFPLVAKSWCEENVRKSSSMYHDFNCRECGKAFPCKAALALHRHTHSPEKTAQCPLCECDFTDAQQLHLHMLKHLSDKAFNDVMIKVKSKHEKAAHLLKSPKSDKIGKHDFLAGFGLTTVSEAELIERERRENTKENSDTTESSDYFAKLGQVYSPDFSYPFSTRKDLNMTAEEQMKAFLEMQKLFHTAAGEMMKNLSPNNFMPGMEGLNPSQLKAFLPAMMPFNMVGSNLGKTTDLAAMMQSNPMLLSTLLSIQNAASPLPTPPPSSDSGSGSSGEMGDKYAGKAGTFQCMYCDLVFNNYRTLKGHVRTHLGLSPYKCNLCSYSSADKSTLIRHLRTHNGERPFQCRICDFAFTTKANCERHVRKKHGKIMKDEVEAAIGYNKYVMESTSTAENFHSPDTVCKYCGEDFKFFRALKHHLRSHSSCRQKPFQCLKCDIGFSTKANCMRHLQKQHHDVAQHQIEQYIQVNGPISEDGDKSVTDSLSDDGVTQDSRNTGTPSSVTSLTSLPPTAHTTPRLTTPNPRLGTPGGSRPQTPVMVKQEVVTVKQEPMDEDEGPLDFSVKSRTPTPSSVKQATTEDAPMDLSVKKKAEPSSAATAKPSDLTKSIMEGSMFQCQFCPVSFSGYLQLERHLIQSHKPLAEIMASQMQNFAIIDPVSGNLKLPIRPPASSSASDRLKVNVKFTAKKNVPLLPKEKIKTEPPAYDPSSDLASVKKILDATKAQNFHSFLTDQSFLSKDKMLKETDTSQSSSNEKEGNSSILEDMDDTAPYSPQSKGSNSNLDEDMDTDMMEIPTPEQFAQMFRDSTGGAFSIPRAPGLPKTLTDPMDKTQLKKKRNSYADSPHKLQCPYCTRTFPWVSSLTRHLLTHTGQKPFKCPRCPVTFSTKSNRERHLIRKHGLNMLDPLSRQTMDRPYKCHLCVFSSFSTQGNLLKHYKERHHGCDLPDTLADLDRAVTKGLSHTIPPHERGRYDPNSPAAQESYNRDNQLNEAEKLSLDGSLDSEKIASPYTASEDLRSEEEEDDIIPLSIDTSSMDEPPPTLPPAATTSTPLPKTNPSKSFTGSAERQINPERDNYNVDKITSCWKCGERFVSRKLLVRHLKEHNIDLPYKCYLCDASYETRKDCLLHQERNHSSDWKILREKNKVEDIDTFSKHMDKVVENNCNKVDQGSVLEIPAQTVDDLKMEVVSADYMQRKVYCSLCPKRFWSLQDLRRHMRSHTGERPFECDICQKRFTLKHSMMRHRKKHTESGSLSPSDDEDSMQGPEESAVPAPKPTHHRPILPRMPAISTIPVLSMPVISTTGVNFPLGMTRESASQGQRDFETPPAKRSDSPAVVAPPTLLNKSPYSSMTVESDVKDNSADILHNLLGVDVGSIDKMLDSADSAAQMLGV